MKYQVTLENTKSGKSKKVTVEAADKFGAMAKTETMRWAAVDSCLCPTFKVGERVKAIALTDRPEVTGLIVDSVTAHGGQHGVAPYYRVNAYHEALGDRLADRHIRPEVIQVEGAERFFAHDALGGAQ